MALRDTTARMRDLCVTLRREGVPDSEIATAMLMVLQEQPIQRWATRNGPALRRAATVVNAIKSLGDALADRR